MQLHIGFLLILMMVSDNQYDNPDVSTYTQESVSDTKSTKTTDLIRNLEQIFEPRKVRFDECDPTAKKKYGKNRNDEKHLINNEDKSPHLRNAQSYQSFKFARFTELDKNSRHVASLPNIHAIIRPGEKKLNLTLNKKEESFLLKDPDSDQSEEYVFSEESPDNPLKKISVSLQNLSSIINGESKGFVQPLKRPKTQEATSLSWRQKLCCCGGSSNRQNRLDSDSDSDASE